MMSLSFKLKGVNKTIKKLSKLSDDIKDGVEFEINKSALVIESDAKRRAPVDTGRLRGSIKTRKAGIGREVYTPLEYAPYIEFGTKSRVDVPPGLEGYAMQFKGSGNSRSGGIYPRPFLFPASEAERPNLLRNLKKVVKNGGK